MDIRDWGSLQSPISEFLQLILSIHTERPLHRQALCIVKQYYDQCMAFQYVCSSTTTTKLANPTKYSSYLPTSITSLVSVLPRHATYQSLSTPPKERASLGFVRLAPLCKFLPLLVQFTCIKTVLASSLGLHSVPRNSSQF